MKALVLLAASSVWLSSCRPERAAVVSPESLPIAVQAAPVQWIDTATPVAAPGLIARTLEADLSFKTGGLIAEVTARDGDEVLAGQVLGSLRLEELDAALAQAESALNKAKRDLERSTSLFAGNVEPLEKRQNAESGVEQAEAAVRAARFNRQTATLTAPLREEFWRVMPSPGRSPRRAAKFCVSPPMPKAGWSGWGWRNVMWSGVKIGNEFDGLVRGNC